MKTRSISRRPLRSSADAAVAGAGDRGALAFLLLALLTGGAGLGYPLLGLVLHLFAIVLLVRFARARGWHRLDSPARFLLIGFGGALLLALVQLVPLPPGVWTMLPGREIAATIDAQMGWDRWRTLSLTPDLTMRAGFAVLVPLAAFALVALADAAQRRRIAQLVVATALASALLGFIQVAMGQSAPILYDTVHRGFGVGLFVNRNHHAVLLLVAILLASLPGIIARSRQPEMRGLAALAPLAIVGLLALGVLATRSRTALVLLPLCLLLSAGLMAQGRTVGKWLAALALIYLVAGFLIAQTDAARVVLERFAWLQQDLRFQYWDNSVFALKASLPWGTGLGSFGVVYPTVEPLGQVGPLRVNHAHNDLLELALEGGIPAILLLLFMGGAIGFAALRGMRADPGHRPAVLAALGGIAIILGFSLVDFPLRMDAIACLFGVLLGLLTLPRPPRSSEHGLGTGASIVILGSAVGLAAICSASMVGDSLARAGQPGLATSLAPWSASAWEARALSSQLEGDMIQSREAAARALAITPLNAGAVRAHGMADLELGAPERGAGLLLSGAALGWRDGLHQLWLAEAAIAAGNAGVAAERIDALLRRNLFSAQLIDQLRALLDMPGGIEAVAARLGERPGWRQGYLNALAQDTPQKGGAILQLLAALRQKGVPAQPDETGLMRWRAAEAQDYALVRALWHASAGTELIGHGSFDGLATPLPQTAPPYAWAGPKIAGIRLALEEDSADKGDALRVSSTGMGGGDALMQSIALAPGTYMLDARVRVDAATGSDRAEWRIDCADGRALARIPIPSGGSLRSRWEQLAGRFEVPAACPSQKIALFLAQGDQMKATVILDDVSLRTLRRNIGSDKVSAGL
ncbi:O-antigen ligase family protein [Sphingomonas sp. R647]|uniref:O-antigen ligase family protein n=1 Tax=Sphingomonas sp. R647 TaxID=2875233 RepID=UPI001CD520AD|nr:O-antigen ligase family protein [Sphingomonas sp. R647]MCA1196357.1 O-antigen ligase family protein [Sphingomonas sp. R647]